MNRETKYLLGGLVAMLLIMAVGAMNVRCNTDRTNAVVNGLSGVISVPNRKQSATESSSDNLSSSSPGANAPTANKSPTLGVSKAELIAAFGRLENGAFEFQPAFQGWRYIGSSTDSTALITVDGTGDDVEHVSFSLIAIRGQVSESQVLFRLNNLTTLVEQIFADPKPPSEWLMDQIKSVSLGEKSMTSTFERKIVTISRDKENGITYVGIDSVGRIMPK